MQPFDLEQKVTVYDWLFRIKQHQVQMMIVRGYHIPEHEMDISSKSYSEQVMKQRQYETILSQMYPLSARPSVAQYRRQLSQAYYHPIRNTYTHVEYLYSDGTKVSKADFDHFIRNLPSLKQHLPGPVDNVIIIHQYKIDNAALHHLTDIGIEPFEFFLESLFLVNTLKHKLQVKHTIISPEKTNEILIDEKVTKSNVPNILPTDPVVKYQSVEKGSMIRYHRVSNFTNNVCEVSYYYRLV